VYTSAPRIKASCLIKHKNEFTGYLWPTCEWALPVNPGSQHFSISCSLLGNKWSLSHYLLYFPSSPSLWYLTVLYTLSSPHFTSLGWVSYSLHFTKQKCLSRDTKPLRESTMKQIKSTCRRTGKRRCNSVYLLPSPVGTRSHTDRRFGSRFKNDVCLHFSRVVLRIHAPRYGLIAHRRHPHILP
jgi:hypothetical protein